MKGFLTSLLGEIAPKAAAPAAGAGLMFPSDDAEAGVKLRLLQDAPTVYNSLRKQLARGRGGPLTPVRIAEKILHDKKIANYDSFGPYARKVDGEQSGEYFKGGVQSLYDEILGAVDDPDPSVVAAMDEWAQARLGREAGVSMAENRAKALALRRTGGGAVAAGAAGAANAQSSPENWAPVQMEGGARQEYDPRSPQEAGFPEWSRYEIGPSHGLPTPTWGDIGNTTLEVLDKPMSGLQGLARGLFGLATGEGLTEAAAQAGHMMQGGSEEGFDRVGGVVESAMAPLDRQFPYLGLGKAAGDTTSLGLSLLSPF
jgi:hypothetical protein